MDKLKYIEDRINKATNNGKCWWLHQALTYLPPKKKELK